MKMLTFTSRAFSIYDKAQTLFNIFDTVKLAFRILTIMTQQPIGSLSTIISSIDIATIAAGFSEAYKIIGPNWKKYCQDIMDNIPAISAQVSAYVITRLPSYALANKAGELRFVII